MVKIRRFGVISVGKMLCILYAIFGLIEGAVFSLVSIVASSAMKGMGMFGILFGIGAIIFMPIAFGIMGFIFGIVIALVYNVVARLVGGIEVDAE
jgi:hypothetical protein